MEANEAKNQIWQESPTNDVRLTETGSPVFLKSFLQRFSSLAELTRIIVGMLYREES